MARAARPSCACRYQQEKLVAKSQALGAGVVACRSSSTPEEGCAPKLLLIICFRSHPPERNIIPLQFYRTLRVQSLADPLLSSPVWRQLVEAV